MSARFFDAHVRPPRGGWHYSIGGKHIGGFSEEQILEEMGKFHRNNGTGKTDGELRAELWNYYCSREPERCGRTPHKRIAEPSGPVAPGEKTPQRQGPPIWTFLNTVAAQWTPMLHDFFLSVLDHISVILECPTCKLEWQSILRDERESVQRLGTRLEVCRWVNRVHNLVNERAGKAQFPYLRMVTDYGAPNP